ELQRRRCPEQGQHGVPPTDLHRVRQHRDAPDARRAAGVVHGGAAPDPRHRRLPGAGPRGAPRHPRRPGAARRGARRGAHARAHRGRCEGGAAVGSEASPARRSLIGRMLRATFLVLASWGAAPRFAQNGSPKPAPTARPDERAGEVWQTWWRGRASNGAARDPWATAPSDAGEWRAAPESLGFWERWRVPALADFDGMVWFRVSARLGPDQDARSRE